MITARTQLNAVIGSPIGHSLSPQFHNEEYRRRGYDAVLLAFEHNDLAALVQAIKTLKVGLTAVTLPFKEQILPFLDEADPVAQALGCANTVIQKDGKLLGFNTDVIGIQKALDGVELSGKTVLLLGAGGVARPVAYVLNKAGAKVRCLNRNRERAEELAAKFGGRIINEGDLDELTLDLIVNATPVGLAPQAEETPLPSRYLRAGQTVFDIVYNPEETRLLREAKAAGAQTRSGMLMFTAQALEQIRLWEILVLHPSN